MAVSLDRRALLRLIELVAVILLDIYLDQIVVPLAAALHFPLPEVPLLHHFYLTRIMIISVFVWIWLRGEDLAEFGLVIPKRWWVTIGLGLLVFVVEAFDGTVLKSLRDPIVAHLTGASPTLAEQHFAPLKGNLEYLLILLPCAWFGGALGEELLFRGFYMTRIAQILGNGRWAWGAALVLQAVLFASVHTYQGPVGMVDIFFAGLISGAATLIWGRTLWPAMIAHGLIDSLGFILVYLGIIHA